MRYQWLGSIASLVVAGAALAQAPTPVSWTFPQGAPDHLPAPNDLWEPRPGATAPPPKPLPPLPVPPPPPAPPPSTPALAPLPAPGAAYQPCSYASSEANVPSFTAHHNPFNSGDDANFWVSAEYLVWWIKSANLPPLVGTISDADAQSGNLGNITAIYGDTASNANYRAESGLRLSTGVWLDEAHTFGIDASFFQLEHKTTGANIASSGSPVLGPVFFDPVAFQQTIVLASLPSFPTGPNAFGPRSATIGIKSNNRLWGADLDGRYQLGAVYFMDHLDLVAGFRHLNFSEGLDMTTQSLAQRPLNPGPDVLAADHFGTGNQFYGGQVGLAAHGQLGRLSCDFLFKLGLGDVHQTVDVNGSTTLMPQGLPQTTSSGGILAQPSNSGHYSTDRFAILPELTFTAGYQLSQHVRATVGYNFLYLSSVMRAADQIDGVDGRQVRSLGSFDPTVQATRPAPLQITDHFYAQGLNFGLEFSY